MLKWVPSFSQYILQYLYCWSVRNGRESEDGCSVVQINCSNIFIGLLICINSRRMTFVEICRRLDFYSEIL
jgi:hypothetical protein